MCSDINLLSFCWDFTNCSRYRPSRIDGYGHREKDACVAVQLYLDSNAFLRHRKTVQIVCHDCSTGSTAVSPMSTTPNVKPLRRPISTSSKSTIQHSWVETISNSGSFDVPFLAYVISMVCLSPAYGSTLRGLSMSSGLPAIDTAYLRRSYTWRMEPWWP